MEIVNMQVQTTMEDFTPLDMDKPDLEHTFSCQFVFELEL
jgi:hypothetical protein